MHQFTLLDRASVRLLPDERTGAESQHGTPLRQIELCNAGLLVGVGNYEVMAGEAHVLIACR